MDAYPDFSTPPALPSATRLMLRNEGSTTVLLQSLVGADLSAEVLPGPYEGPLPASDHLDAVFGAVPDGELAVRRSRLRDPSGALVSENAITFRGADRAGLIPPGRIPFGLHTRRLGLYERRRILGAGLTTRRFGLLPAGSPGRAYEIEFSNGVRVLVHEVFSPALVPTGEQRPAAASVTHHQPDWPAGAGVERVRAVLAGVDPLVSDADCRDLRARLAGPGFLLQAGDCAETFRDNTPSSVARRVALFRAMSDRVTAASGHRVVTVGRIAGQYAKPRSAPVERRGELALPSYLGDAVNATGFSVRERAFDPGNLLRAYQESSKTLSFMAGSGVFASHEALLLDYERPQTRRSSADGRDYALSGHLLWIGERTRALDGPHIAFAAGIHNPVAVKVGPSCTPDELLALHGVLNPDNAPGRLTFVLRMGRERAYERGHVLMAAAARQGLADRFVSDPMHGNTVTSPAGVKTRSLAHVEEELRAFFAACRDTGTEPGGVHLEVSGDDVTECVADHPDDAYLATAYRSSCDPRLNPAQALRVADLVGELLAPVSAQAPALGLPALT
ncbi:3-deoxy-7-phosphoheptulonate synthase [Streptomyces sp. NPDC001941]|uniref:3-deoxy-7-phosphoheptulonate synthase n=1 Tax=Streptomyces sp. NPDC001941 TaxID=3154659 RepID=UPI00332A0FFF